MKTATNIDEQIKRLKERGMDIDDDDKARDVLLDIGYYRLGFYWFPFEKTYPNKIARDHHFIDGASFRQAVDLYYLDCEMRNLLAPFLYRIEINLRTFLIYTVSNYYKSRPTWFADSRVVNSGFVKSLSKTYETISNNEAIKRHHQKYPNDIYAPAWKTLEYMTFGDIITLLYNLKDNALKEKIADHYGIRNMNVFWSYMNTIRIMRNLCAHGHNIFDLNLQKSIKAGPLSSKMSDDMYHNLCGVLLVVFYLLHHISDNRKNELKVKLRELMNNTSLKQFDYIKAVL